MKRIEYSIKSHTVYSVNRSEQDGRNAGAESFGTFDREADAKRVLNVLALDEAGTSETISKNGDGSLSFEKD